MVPAGVFPAGTFDACCVRLLRFARSRMGVAMPASGGPVFAFFFRKRAAHWQTPAARPGVAKSQNPESARAAQKAHEN